MPLANTAMLISISGTTAKVEAVHSCCINLHERPIPGLTDEEEVRLDSKTCLRISKGLSGSTQAAMMQSLPNSQRVAAVQLAAQLS